MTTSRPGSGILLTLDRGIQVLEEIAAGEGFTTAKSLVATLDINTGTIYQILRTLQSNGYVQRLPGGRYELGNRIGFLIDHYEANSAPPPEIIDQLHRLHLETGETVYAAVARGTSIPIVASHEGTRRLRVGKAAIGFADHPHARASGKAFLAACDEADLDAYFDDRRLERLTEHTITDWDTLLGELAEIRSTGVAYERDEADVGISTIGAMFRGADGQPVGAYAAALPSSRFDDERDSIAGALRRAADETSHALGLDDDS